MTRTEQLYLRGLSLVEVVTIGEEGQVFGFASLSCDSSPTENKLLVSRAQLLGLAVQTKRASLVDLAKSRMAFLHIWVWDS